MLPLSASAAPVGNLYDPALWDVRPFDHSSPLSLIVGVELDRQDNVLPAQIRRFPWTDPTGAPEERHYPQTRSSRNILTTTGVKIGKPVSDLAQIYALVGSCESDVDFHYEDWTVSRSFSSDDSFRSGPDMYYGIGATFLMHTATYDNTIPWALAMDIKYRRFDIKDDKRTENGTSYACTLDEIQIAFALSARLSSFSPYAGVKVASITGEETYINENYNSAYFPQGHIHYEDKIIWFKNIGCHAGVTMDIFEWFSLGLEVRFGDEKGMGIQAMTRF